MFDACNEVFPSADIAIFSAAVSDARPKETADHKLKKGIDDAALRTIELVENPDILASMGARKKPAQLVVGFAAETDDVEGNARKKLESKHADMIVGNDVSGGRGFGADDNRVLVVSAKGTRELPLMSKGDLANALLDLCL